MAIPRFKPEPCPFIGQLCEYVPMAHRMVKLEKEIERLREALQKIYDDDSPEYIPEIMIKHLHSHYTIARDALEEKE